MPTLDLYKQNGQKSGTVTLADSVFGAEINIPLMHEVVVAQLAAKRQGTKSALTRAEVRGGGKKPWRQKKTGRARQGSIRSPQWKGGGVVFAPKPRDFDKKVNKKAKVAALKSALSAKVKDGELMVLENIELIAAKTKEVADILKSLGINKSVLIVLPENQEQVIRASRNIPGVTTINSDLINVYDILRHNRCLMLKDAAKKIEEAYANE